MSWIALDEREFKGHAYFTGQHQKGAREFAQYVFHRRPRSTAAMFRCTVPQRPGSNRLSSTDECDTLRGAERRSCSGFQFPPSCASQLKPPTVSAHCGRSTGSRRRAAPRCLEATSVGSAAASLCRITDRAESVSRPPARTVKRRRSRRAAPSSALSCRNTGSRQAASLRVAVISRHRLPQRAPPLWCSRSLRLFFFRSSSSERSIQAVCSCTVRRWVSRSAVGSSAGLVGEREDRCAPCGPPLRGRLYEDAAPSPAP